MTERELRTAHAFCEEWMSASGGAPATTTALVPLAVRTGMIEPRGLCERGVAMALGRRLQEIRHHLPYDAVRLRAHQSGRRWALYPKETA